MKFPKMCFASFAKTSSNVSPFARRRCPRFGGQCQRADRRPASSAQAAAAGAACLRNNSGRCEVARGWKFVVSARKEVREGEKDATNGQKR